MQMQPEEIPITGGQRVSNQKVAISRTFRKNPTTMEAQVWEWLRGRACLGLKFRRQQVIMGFIADFYCAERRIVIELDGGVHDEAFAYDSDRDKIFASIGIKILRIKNENCTKENLMEGIRKTTSPPAPSP